MPSIIVRYAVVAVLFVGCTASPKVVPETLESQVDKNVTFTQIKDDPISYAGKTVVLGGEVLNAKRLRTGILLEILEIPLHDWEPQGDRTKSRGRFLAFNKAGLDPAAIPPSTRVTVVGDVTGSTKQALDEAEYTYPTVEVRHIKVWDPRIPSEAVGGPRWGFSIGGGTGVGVGGGIGIGF